MPFGGLRMVSETGPLIFFNENRLFYMGEATRPPGDPYGTSVTSTAVRYTHAQPSDLLLARGSVSFPDSLIPKTTVELQK